MSPRVSAGAKGRGFAAAWDLPYRSRRSPVLARNVVTTTHPLAAQAGVRMLLRGGNAVDAAVASAIALTVVEPTANGIGADLFAIVWDGEHLHGLNASGRSPRSLDSKRLLAYGEMPPQGWDTVTVPGAVSGWAALSERFGELPFAELVAPAIEYAREGSPPGPNLAEDWAEALGEYAAFPDLLEVFAPSGRAPRAGEYVRLPDHARTLELIATSHGEEFYRGALARRIADCARAQGGALREGDLADHVVRWVEPLSFDYGSVTVHELPPNGQGVAVLIALGILAHSDYHEFPVGSAASLHYEIEAMKLAFRDAHEHVADPDAMRVSAGDLLDSERLAKLARGIDPRRALDPRHGAPPPAGTVYVASADSAGRMVSLIQSNYVWFGSGIVVPGTGIALQNRGVGFSCVDGNANVVAPGKLPFHTIIPAFVSEHGAARCCLGLIGGPMQPQGHVQLLTRLVDRGENAQAALDAPRWKVEDGLDVALEPGWAPATIDGLRDRGHRLTVTEDAPSFGFNGFGFGQLIVRRDEGYLAASDPRADGQACGF